MTGSATSWVLCTTKYTVAMTVYCYTTSLTKRRTQFWS